MEGSRVCVPAVLARVVRSFAGSRLERELLAQAFALIRPARRARVSGPVPGAARPEQSPRGISDRKGA